MPLGVGGRHDSYVLDAQMREFQVDNSSAAEIGDDRRVEALSDEGHLARSPSSLADRTTAWVVFRACYSYILQQKQIIAYYEKAIAGDTNEPEKK